jgi:hypothetical protein
MKKIVTTLFAAILLLNLTFMPVKKAEAAVTIAGCVQYGMAVCTSINTIAIFGLGVGIAYTGGKTIYDTVAKYLEMDENEREFEDIFGGLVTGILATLTGALLMDEDGSVKLKLTQLNNEDAKRFSLNKPEMIGFNENVEELNLLVNQYSVKAQSITNAKAYKKLQVSFQKNCKEYLGTNTCNAYKKISEFALLK